MSEKTIDYYKLGYNMGLTHFKKSFEKNNNEFYKIGYIMGQYYNKKSNFKPKLDSIRCFDSTGSFAIPITIEKMPNINIKNQNVINNTGKKIAQIFKNNFKKKLIEMKKIIN